MPLDNKVQIAKQYTPEIEILNSKINTLKQVISTKEHETNTLYTAYITEAEGTNGTKKLGKGSVYEEKKAKHDASLLALNLLKTKTEKN